MAEILRIRRKTLYNQSTILRNQHIVSEHSRLEGEQLMLKVFCESQRILNIEDGRQKLKNAKEKTR